MTAHVAPRPSPGPSAGHLSRGPAAPSRLARQRGTLLVLVLVALAHLGAWWALNRPVAMPDFRGQVNGLAFAPYQRGQSAEGNNWPSAEQIEGDLRRVAPMTRHIRTYAVHGGMERIPELAWSTGLDLKVTLGSWLDRRLDRNAAELRRLVQVARESRNVERVLVGNEAVLRGDVTAAQMVGYIQQVKRQVRQPVSTAEPWHVWMDHPEIGDAVDYITIHLLPYWEGLPVDDALRFIMEKFDAVQARFPNKQVVIGEVGWPSDGVAQGAARASRVNQALFMRSFFNIAEQRGLDYFVMEAFDQPWKVSFEGRAAGHWGMYDLDRHQKWPLTGAVQETPAWTGWAIGASLVSFLAAFFFLSRRPDIRWPGKVMLAALSQGFVALSACVLLAMSETYMSTTAGVVWSLLVAGQVLLLALLLSDSFELAETVFGRVSKRRWPALPAEAGAQLPKVSIHLPICNEPPHMVRQTLEALAELDYPDFEVLVVDNNTTDPAIWEPVAEHCARLGSRFRFYHLGKWPGYKAGALNFALRETAPDAEIVGVIDSDYLVRPDWLRRMVPFFERPEVGFTQSPQDYRDGNGGLFKRLMFWEYAGFFKAGMVTRNERNAIIQHGTMTLIRKSAMLEVGGLDGKTWAEWCICEDSELGLKLMRRGWEAVYCPDSMGRGVMPDDFAAYRKQRHRWAMGAIQIMKGHWRALLNPFDRSLTQGQRFHFVMGWMPWIGDALGLAFVIGGLAWSIGLVLIPLTRLYPTVDLFGMSVATEGLRTALVSVGLSDEFPITLFMLPSLGLFAFKLLQIWMLYRARVACSPLDRLGAALGGLALTHTIGKAVWQGFYKRRAHFARTPKMENAPALVQGLLTARQEGIFLLLLWLAAAGITLAHRGGTWEAILWTVILLVQSIPYLAAVSMAVIAALPSAQVAVLPGAAPVQSSAGQVVARSEVH
ncbi:glycosyltransferase [Roseomonas chloroacetimidivorans]|jgi:exo-beta-1,3-glucanase (GH17 family)/cellulose synthase/poly-beta-1,6-N-acetylglucosamine synthase-like glycosyltransferase|uniref:glycosyltransferase n=1 Tax=Roseomonas chloroacetimidivorans TaxID=1766656 RepID=UPI003C768715